MSGILAGSLSRRKLWMPNRLVTESPPTKRDHNVLQNELRDLRLQAGVRALSSILRENLETYFQKPIENLNKKTLGRWQTLGSKVAKAALYAQRALYAEGTFQKVTSPRQRAAGQV
jgi:hypothetical protein